MSDQEITFDVAALPTEGSAEYRALIEQIIAEFRAGGGQVGGPLAGVPLLLLTTTGARSGLPRTTPVTYLIDGDRLIVVAAREGDTTRHPDWYHNLVANPDVTVELGEASFPARTTVLAGEERERLFARFAAAIPPAFAGYLHKTAIEIPVIALTRAG